MKNNYFTKAISATRRHKLRWLCLVALIMFSARSYGQVGAYSYAQSNDTYTAITTGGILLGDTATDDNSFADPALPTTTVLAGPGIPIGFSFTYGGYTFDRIGVNANGWISLGNSALTPSVNVGANSYVSLSATTTTTPAELRCRISALSADLQSQGPGLTGGVGVAGDIRVVTVGTAPNRTLVVQWTGYRRFGAAGDNLNFQIRLNEGSNTVQIRYGTMVHLGSSTFQVGLGGISSGEFNNRTNTTDWLTSTAGTINTASMTGSPTVTAPSGLTFVYTPPVAGNITSAATGNWSSPATWVGGIIPHYLSDVVIAAGHVVTVDVPSVFVPTLTVGGAGAAVNFNAAAVRNFTVTGNLTVSAGATFSTAPTTGTSARQIFVNGNIVNNGTMDLSTNATILVLGGAAQTLSGTGTFTNGTIREMQTNTFTLSMPINVSARYTLLDGILTTNGNLTMDNTVGGVVTGAVTFRRSVVTPPIVGAIAVGATALYNLDYVFFSGQAATSICTTGTEIPASRTINGIRLAGGTGTQLIIAGGNLTMTSSSSSTATTFPNTATAPGALAFSSGIFVVPSGSEMILSNGALANITGGSATAYIRGKMTWTVSSTAAQTRNFSIGNGTDRFLMVLAGINTGGVSRTYSAEIVGAPSGSVTAPVSAIMGTRAVRITSSGPMPATSTVALTWTAADVLNLGTPAQIRLVQASALTGSWTERSISTTANTLATGTRTSAAGIDLANGEFFALGTTSPSEITIASVSSPGNSGCYTATETVRAVLFNAGAPLSYSGAPVTVRGSVTGPSGTTNLTAVVRNSGSISAAGTDTITFTPAVNFTDQGTYQVNVYIDSIAGQTLAGDSLTRSVRSTVYTVTVSPPTILQGSSASLSVGSPDGVRISEVTLFYGGQGQTGANYPAYVTGSTGDPDLLEISNFSGLAANISGFTLEIVGAGARSFTFPAGVLLAPGATLILHLGIGTDIPASNFYNTGGANGSLSSSSSSGYILTAPGGAIIDVIGVNGYTFAPTTGVTASDWSGAIPSSSGRAGVMMISPDNNTAGSWIISSTTDVQTIGALNPGFSASPATVVWTGPGTFTATGATASTGVRANIAVENYTATITVNGCAKSSSGTLTVIAPVPPIAGFMVSDTTATMGGIISTVTLTDTSRNVPTNWKWTITPNNAVFVNATADTTKNAQIEFTTPGTYSVKLRVTNPAGADSLVYSKPIVVTLAYCASLATSTADTKIDSVVFGANTFGSLPTACEGYTDNTAFGSVANVVRSFPYAFQLKNGSCSGNHYGANLRAYADINRDGLFDAAEEVGALPLTTILGWNTVNITLPANTDTGLTRLRIVLREGSIPTGCGTYSWGETEDYTIRVVAPALTNFSLIGPADSAFVNIDGQSTTPVSVNWERSIPATGSVSYAWQLAARAAGNFNAPLATLTANNSGADTVLTLTFGAINQLMASLGVNVGDTVRGIWRVRAVRGTDTLYSAGVRNIDLRRGTVIFNCPVTALPVNIVGATICGSGSATLSAGAPGSQEVVWYNTNGTVGAVGTSITTGTISANTTFQVGLANKQNGNQAFGPIAPTTGTFPGGNFSNGMYYTVLAPVRIDSITFFSNGPRDGAVQIWDKNPTVDPTAVILQVAPWSLTAAGVTRVPVSIYLTPGSYYMNNTYGAGTGILFRTTGGATFPYVLAGKISLDSSWLAPGSNLARIYYFFDMRVSDACYGPTAPATVSVTVAPSATLPYIANLETAGIPCNYINGGAWQAGTAASLSGAGFTIPAPAAGTGIAAAKTAGRLISPSFNFSSVTPVSILNLTFNAYNNGTLGSKAYVEVSVDSGVTFTRVDSVAAGAAWQTKTVSLSAYAGRPSVHFAFNHAITAGAGSGFAVDNIALNTSCGASQVVVNIRTDIFGSEVTWTLRDSVTNNLIAAGGPYPDVNPYNAAAATHIDTFCVPNNTTLQFRISDSYGDGLWDGTNAGTYNVGLICPAGLVTLFAGADSLPYGSVANPPQYDSAFVRTTCFIPDTMSVFNLLTPANSTAVTLQGLGTQTVNFTWQPSARSVGTTPVTYTWSLETATNNPLTLTSRSGLTSPSLNIDYGVLADTLSARGVIVNGVFNGRWKVVATSGTLTKEAVAKFNISLTRGIISSIDENELGRAMSLYPNPAENQATLAYNFDKNVDLKVVLVNPVGQEVLSLNENNALRGEVLLDISSLQSGLYFVRISDGNTSTVKRLMIQR